MSATDTNSVENNGKAPDQPGMSYLDSLDKEFQALHKGKTTDKRKAELVKALTESQKAVAAAEKALDAAKAAESNAVAAIIREASGRSRITIKGETFSPASRGSKVYLRKVSAESIELA